MRLTRIKFIILPIALMLLSPLSGSTQQLTHKELVYVLGVKSWRVPLPKDEAMEWGIEMVDYSDRKLATHARRQSNSPKKALIVLRPIDTENYQFTLKQRNGSSQGNIAINGCRTNERDSDDCRLGYSIEWHDIPQAFDNGTKFLLADISPARHPGQPGTQIILVPKRFRR